MKSFKEFTDWFDGIIWTPWLFFLLLGCGLLFSVASKLVQWRALTHGFQVIRGKYDREDDAGHISHFQALCAALSATIGLGNIAGVGVAVTLGGPGAVFWMWIVGFFGMSIKFVECSLATMFRDEQDVPDASSPAGMTHDAETRTLEYEGEAPPAAGAKATARGEVRGGPMWYIQKALVDPHKARGSGLWVVFKIMAIIYALIIALASFGGGNMFQSWNVGNQLSTFGVDPRITGAVIAFLVSLVIIGGIKRIGNVASKLVPGMCVLYVIGSLIVIFQNMDQIGSMFALIIDCAFNAKAGEGAFAGVSVYLAFELGLKRALFSNEAGQGSAAIAHAAAKTDEPIREGVVAAMGPFIDTIIICTMTALVVLSTGVWNRPAVGTVASIDGDSVRIAMTPTAEIPERLRDVHYAEITNKHTKLWVLVEREQGTSPKLLPAAASKAVVEMPASEIAGLGEMQIRIDRGDEADDPEDFSRRFSALSIGQPVHLGIDGAEITRFALDTVFVGFGKWIILIGVCLFAFSTMISWSYYGEKGTEYLLGRTAILPYKILFVIAIFAGCTFSQFKPVYNFSDAMTGLTVFCNLPACLILLPTLIRAANGYFKRLDSGEMKRTK